MDIDLVLTYLPIILIALGLFYIWLKYKAKEPVMSIPVETLGLIVEVGVFIFLIFMVEAYVFVEHDFFSLTIMLFTPIWVFVIYSLLRGDDIYILVSSFQGDKFADPDALQYTASESTRQRLLIMPREVYESKRHIGDLSYPYWRGSTRVHFADYYNDKKGYFYHHQDPRLKNITFYIAKPYWLKLRDELPKIMRENIILTWLSNYYIAHKQKALAKSFAYHLRALDKQHEHEPFTLPDDIDELMDFLKNEKARGLSVSEESQAPAPAPKTEEASQ